MPSSARYTAAMAADPGLAQSDMQEIAESRPDLLAALASNPALYPALREWLEQHPDPAVRTALAAQEAGGSASSAPPDNNHGKSSQGKRILLALMGFLLVASTAFGTYWFVLRDDDTVLKKPAPEGALNISGFSGKVKVNGSDEGNLQCLFTQDDDGKDLVKCTVWKYTFDPGVDCSVPGAPVTYELYAEGPVTKRCDKTDAVSGMPKGVYGTAMAQNGFACTLEKYNGIICWSEKSGEGFQVQKRLDRTF